MEEIKSIEQYHELISQDKPVVMKFFAEWCPDCRKLDKFIGGVVTEHNNKDWFAMNTEQFQSIAEENDVRGIPSLLVFEKVAKTPDQIREFLADY
jgi:thioredoxin 1